MPDAIITSTASTFGTITGTFAADQSTITGTVTGIVAGTLSGSVGVPGPQGPAGNPGQTGPQGPQGEPGEGVPAGGTEGQIIVKNSATDYDTEWVDNFSQTVQATVRNETGATLSKGTVVYINGGAGNKPLVVKASASSESGSSKTFAILAEDILNNQNGQATTMGLLKGLNTSAFSAGANLWLSTTPGAITSTPPVSPAHAVFLGNVVRVNANDGEIEVRIQNGYELGELHDVLITTPTNGQVLKYDSATSLWVNGLDVGVPAGGTSGQFLQKVDGTDYNTDWVTLNLSAYAPLNSPTFTGTPSLPTGTIAVTQSALDSSNAIATTQFVQNELTGYLTIVGAEGLYYPLTGNPSGFLTSAPVSSVAGKTGAVSLFVSDISGAAPVSSPAFTGNPTAPTPATGDNDTSIATTAFVKAQGYLTSASLSGYATESFVTSQGYITSSALSPYLTSATAASTYQTIAGMSSYLTTASAASTYYLQTNPAGYITSSALSGYATESWVTAGFYPLTGNPSGFLTSAALTGYATESYVNSQGFITSSALSGYATESWVSSQGYLTSAPVTSVAGKTGAVTLAVADVSGAAPLASPGLTGTPTAPTASAGTNTTQIATTAFVTTAVPSFASVTNVINNPLSTTTSMSPWLTINSACNPNVRSIAHITSTAISGSGQVGGVNLTGAGLREMYTTATASAGRAGYYYGKSDATPGYNNSNWRIINWSKRVIVSGRAMMGSTDYSTNYNGDANTSCRIYLGGRSVWPSTGDMNVRGIGIFKVGGNSTFVQLQVHNGTTLTTVASSFQPASGEAFSWTIYSDGAGNVTLYINGSSVATTSSGPTGNSSNYHTVYAEQVEATASAAVRQIFYCFGGYIYIET